MNIKKMDEGELIQELWEASLECLVSCHPSYAHCDECFVQVRRNNATRQLNELQMQSGKLNSDQEYQRNGRKMIFHKKDKGTLFFFITFYVLRRLHPKENSILLISKMIVLAIKEPYYMAKFLTKYEAAPYLITGHTGMSDGEIIEVIEAKLFKGCK